jgi:type II restriction/modification system DNA methylase subunit YeeA
MDTSKLKKFAQFARRTLIEQVQSKLKLVLAADSAARREHPRAIKELVQKLSLHKDKKEGEKQLIEQVAYTWFNRFCALRFMDVNQYNRIMVLSPISGQFQPELLAEAKAGHLDDVVFNGKTREKIQGLLSGSIPSRDGQSEAYRMMIVAVCNDYHRLMPYLFQRIEDYTELLMPDDLLSGNSILAYTREAMTPENCESVESIGWLYQFYISEKKDLVFEGLKKNKKITAENIPAATQLFTPHWIVKYLVENSLGRLWMLNNPNSKVIEQMKYYIKPVEEEMDFLRINTPEEIKLCDPAVGSGHMLTYAYDLLYAIYLEANYDATDIPELILTKNLFGIEIDERAAELAAFALSMKAIKGNPADESNNRRRFFRNPIKPNICRLENVNIDEAALEEYIEFAGRDLFTRDLRKTLTEFEEADNFGSLIQPTLKNPSEILDRFEAKNAQVDLFLKDTHESILKVLKQAKYLSPIYQVVTANPPYLGSKGMNAALKSWAGNNYSDSKADLYTMFMERNINLSLPSGMVAMINMQAWMFLSTLEKLRTKLIKNVTFLSMAHIGTRGFDSIGGEVVSTTAFVMSKMARSTYKGEYFRLVEGRSELEKSKCFQDILAGRAPNLRYRSSADDFNVIPNNPLAYWVSPRIRSLFGEHKHISSLVASKNGITSGDNDIFLRLWHEVSQERISTTSKDREGAEKSSARWFPHNKGGTYRKWYGNLEYVLDWENDGKALWAARPKATVRNPNYFFKPCISWSDVVTGPLSFRYYPEGHTFDAAANSTFSEGKNLFLPLLALANNCLVKTMAPILNPTMHFKIGDFGAFPIVFREDKDLEVDVNNLIQCTKIDWDSYETSWDFTKSPLLLLEHKSNKLQTTYDSVRAYWQTLIDNTLELEEKNNQLFIDLYDLKDELDPSVPLNEITLTCNPTYRYGLKGTEREREEKLRKDTICEFISYMVGCLFGRYSLDQEGIILANQYETLTSYMTKIPYPTYTPDEDNVVPIIDFEGDWFEDDIAERFKAFLKVTFGEENFAENLAFIEAAIGKDIKKYFAKDFYTDHLKRYKKRPIYWMFSSPNGSFNALIYMHRYQPDTVSIVLNDYLREFRTKLEARKQSYEQVEISASASQKDKTQAIKAIANINKVLEEINYYEHDVLYPLAGKKIPIDLDDGVKHNYPLFSNALKKVTGLS